MKKLLLSLIALVSIGQTFGQFCVDIPQITSFDNQNYIKAATPTDAYKTDGLWLGQGVVKRNTENRPAYIPHNKRTWAIAIAVAWNMERNQNQRVDYPKMGSYLAAATMETELSCVTGLTWENPSQVPKNYAVAAINMSNTGCFQFEGPQSAYNLIATAYPHRFKTADYELLAEGVNNFETSILLKLYYDRYTRAAFEDNIGWDLSGTFDCTEDVLAYTKSMSSAYNAGHNSFSSNEPFFNGTPNACWSGLAGTTSNYSEDVASFTATLENNTTSCDFDNSSTFDHYYDKNIGWSHIQDYLGMIDTIYPELDWEGTIIPAVQTVFNATKVKDSLNYKAMGPVIDAIILQLPNDYPNLILGSPVGLDPDVCNQAKAPFGIIKKVQGNDTICLGQLVEFEAEVLSNSEANATVYWVDLSDTSIHLGSGNAFSFSPSSPGEISIGAKICNSKGCYLVGCDKNALCFDERNPCGIDLVIENCTNCDLEITAINGVAEDCNLGNNTEIGLKLNDVIEFNINYNGPVTGQSFHSLTDTATLTNIPQGFYDIEVVDVNHPNCTAYTSINVAPAMGYDFELDASIFGVESCGAFITGKINPLPTKCNRLIRAYVPDYGTWENAVILNIEAPNNQNYHGGYNVVSAAGDFNQWASFQLMEKWVNVSGGNELDFDLSLINTPGAIQGFPYHIDILDENETILESFNVPKESLLSGASYSVGTHTVACPVPTRPDYDFDFNPFVQNVVDKDSAVSGTTQIYSDVSYNSIITATPNDGSCALTDTVFIEKDLGCIVSSVSKVEQTISLYPNPSRNFVQIESTINGQISIFNNQGQLVYSVIKNEFNSTINTEALNSGVYFVRIQNETHIGQATLTIQK